MVKENLQPSQGEIDKAEEMMTPELKKLSEERLKEALEVLPQLEELLSREKIRHEQMEMARKTTPDVAVYDFGTIDMEALEKTVESIKKMKEGK